jgi:hypothetical protein
MQGLAGVLVRRRRRDSTCGDASVIDSARKVIAKSCLEDGLTNLTCLLPIPIRRP